MSVAELLQAVQFVVKPDGRPAAVQMDMATWESLCAGLFAYRRARRKRGERDDLHDALGRTNLTTVNNPGSPVTTRNYFDRLRNVTERLDPKGIDTRYEYDALNRLTAVVENYCPAFPANAEAHASKYAVEAALLRFR